MKGLPLSFLATPHVFLQWQMVTQSDPPESTCRMYVRITYLAQAHFSKQIIFCDFLDAAGLFCRRFSADMANQRTEGGVAVVVFMGSLRTEKPFLSLSSFPSSILCLLFYVCLVRTQCQPDRSISSNARNGWDYCQSRKPRKSFQVRYFILNQCSTLHNVL